MDHINKLAELTGTVACDWEEAEGPDTRVGVDFYYSHTGGMWARINIDQDHTTIDIFDIEGDEVLSESFDEA